LNILAICNKLINLKHTRAIFKSVLDAGLGFVLSAIATTKLRKAMRKCRSIEDYVNLAYSFSAAWVNIRPQQIKEEITELLQILEKLDLKLYLR